MDTGTKITGKVTGPDGSAVAGANLRIETADAMPGMGRMNLGFGGANTDGEGIYALEAVEPGERTLSFEKEGFQSATKTLTVSGREMRVDVTLGRGATVTGVVVTDSGAPVADASVTANPGSGQRWNQTRSDANGNFRFEGLEPLRYTFSAGKAGLMDGEVGDVDVITAGNVRIVLGQGARITGRIIGLEPKDYPTVTVSASNETGSGRGGVDSSGRFTIDGAPVGTVRVRASREGGLGTSVQTTDVKTVEVQSGAEATVDLEFKTGVVISGRVERGGQAVEGAMVRFTPKTQSIQTTASASTDARGRYEVNGLASGEYNVMVLNMQKFAPYNTTYTVNGSGNFDIEIATAVVRGRVVDAETSEPIAAAVVTLQQKGASSGVFFGSRQAQTDPSGNFVVEDVTPGSYSALAQKDSYGQQSVDIEVGDSGLSDVELKLSLNEGTKLRAVDGRDGRAIDASVRVVDGAGRVAFEGNIRASADGTKLSLSSGGYRASVFADGYAPRMATITAPSPAPVTVSLTPGGTVEITSRESSSQSAKLVTSTGEAYLRSFFMRQPNFRVDPGRTLLENITPGSYTLVLLGASGAPEKTYPVNVAEGQVTRVSF
jgi:hypothetical protein